MAFKDVAYQVGQRRANDFATSYAATDKAKKLLSWQAKLKLEDMCREAWRWQDKNLVVYE